MQNLFTDKNRHRQLRVHAAIVVTLLSAPSWAQLDPQLDTDIVTIVNDGLESPVKKDLLCIERPRRLSSAVVVGIRDAANKCVPTYVVVGSERMELSKAGTYLLNAQQWHEKAPVDRAELAKEWVVNAVLAFTHVLIKPDKSFLTAPAVFHGPRSESDSEGGAHITVWVANPVPNSHVPSYSELRVSVSSSAETGPIVELQRVKAVPPKPKESDTPR